MAALPKVTLTAVAKEILDEADARDLARAIGALEAASHLDKTVLEGIGMGCASGVRLLDCTTAEEQTKARVDVVASLLRLDRKLREKHGDGQDDEARARSAALVVGRKVVSLVKVIRDTWAAREGGAHAAAAESNRSGTTIVVAESEEDRNFTMPSYDQATVKAQEGVLTAMYNIELRPFEKPSHGQMKRIAYWVKQEGCWPDAERMPLSMFKRAPTDSAYIQFKRKAVGVAIVAAGEAPWAECRDEGAPQRKYGAQWAHAKVLEGLVKEGEELRERLSPKELAFVMEVMDESMTRSTRTAGYTATHAAQDQIAKIGEHVAAARGRSGQTKDKEAEKPPKDKKRKGEKGAKSPSAKVAKAAVPGQGPTGKGAGSGKGAVAYKDEEGTLGPNGLPRKAGGNPAGAKCVRMANSGACPFATCSFSHA